MCKFSLKKTMAHDDVTCGPTARKILRDINGLATLIELTRAILMSRHDLETLRHLAPFLHVFIFGNIFAQDYGFYAVTVTRLINTSIKGLINYQIRDSNE